MNYFDAIDKAQDILAECAGALLTENATEIQARKFGPFIPIRLELAKKALDLRSELQSFSGKA